jgi:hypothetical protein
MQQNTPADSEHVRLQRLIGFMLDGVPLSDEEHTHLFHCDRCSKALANEVADELKRRSNTERTAREGKNDLP